MNNNNRNNSYSDDFGSGNDGFSAEGTTSQSQLFVPTVGHDGLDNVNDGIEVTGGDGDSHTAPVLIETHGSGPTAFRTRSFFVSGAQFVQVNDQVAGTTGWSAPVFVPTIDDVATSIHLGIQRAIEDVETRAGANFTVDQSRKRKAPRKRARRTTQKFTRRSK